MKLELTDAIVVGDDLIQQATEAERTRAREVAVSLATSIGVSQDAALACARWLERIVVTADVLDLHVNSDFATESSRRVNFSKKARSLQATIDRNQNRAASEPAT